MIFSIFPKTIYKTHSKISGEIVVKEQLGQLTLEVGGIIQSGGIVKGIWKKPINKIYNLQFKINNCLILGLGGGTAVHLIKARWPMAKITAVEVNPEIIRIGRKIFDLDKFKDLKIFNADAFKWLKSCSYDLNHKNRKFDLIIIDLYLGKQFPKEAESERFIKNIKKLLAKNGVAIFNRLKTDQTKMFGERLKKH